MCLTPGSDLVNSCRSDVCPSLFAFVFTLVYANRSSSFSSSYAVESVPSLLSKSVSTVSLPP